MKSAYLCMDVESFYDTTCLQKADLTPSPEYDCAEEVATFLDFLDAEGIKATFFVNVSFLDRCEAFLSRAVASGHEIALHSLKHVPPKDISLDEFANDITEAKRILHERLGVTPVGYRAPCFGLNDEQMEVVKREFLYDSSALNYREAKDAGTVTLSGYRRINDALLEKDGFYEYPVQQGKLLGKDFPISGGGYARLMFWHVVKKPIFRHILNGDGYMFYVHPFEIARKPLPRVKGIAWYERLYLRIGRRSYLQKIRQIIAKLKECGYEFKTMRECTESHEKGERYVDIG